MLDSHTSEKADKLSNLQVADRVMRRWEAAKTERMRWMSLWDEMAKYVRPERDEVFRRHGDSGPPAAGNFLFDGTPISANMVLASGCMSRLTPAQAPWFAFDPPRALKTKDAVKRWYAECTEIAIEALATSNFYTELHECYLDRGAFGTCLLHVEGSTGMDSPLVFRAHEIGHYALSLGADGRINTVFRELEFTPAQAAQEYGEQALPECLKKVLKEQPHSQEKHAFIHAIYPREEAERDRLKMDGANKPVASVHIYVKERLIVRNAGYDEMPAIGSRYLRWGTGAYGICPAWMAMADCRSLNELQMNLDVLAGLHAFPRILAPHDFEGMIDLRQGQVTFYKDENRMPREWATQGKYDIGMERVQARQKAIRDFFHVELFQMWSAITKQMTAFEVSAREQEKIELFSPTFTMLSSEMYGPLLRRVFALLLRQGVFPQPPQEAVYVNSAGRYAIPDPEIRYTSRLALALKAVHAGAFDRSMGRLQALAQVRPDVLDNINMDRAVRDMAMNEGLPVEWITPEDEVTALRDARAEQQAQQEQMQQAMMGAEMAGKMK